MEGNKEEQMNKKLLRKEDRENGEDEGVMARK